MWVRLTSVLMRLSDQFLSRSHEGDIVSSDGCCDIHWWPASCAYVPTATHWEVWLQQGALKSPQLRSCYVWANGCIEIWQWWHCCHYCSICFMIAQCWWLSLYFYWPVFNAACLFLLCNWCFFGTWAKILALTKLECAQSCWIYSVRQLILCILYSPC